MSVFELQNIEFAAAAVDVILVAPQVRFLRRSIERRVESLGIAVLPIEPMDFGMADGEAILSKLLRQPDGTETGGLRGDRRCWTEKGNEPC